MAQESAALAARSTTTVRVPPDGFIDWLLGLACWSISCGGYTRSRVRQLAWGPLRGSAPGREHRTLL